MKSKVLAKLAGMSAHDQRRLVILSSFVFWGAVLFMVLKVTL